MKLIIKVVAIVAFLLGAFLYTDINKNYIRSITKNAVVKVYVPDLGSGSGFFIKTRYGIRILTNRHVCQIAPTGFKYHDEDLTNIKYGDIDKISTTHDLCIIKPRHIEANQNYLTINFIPVKLGQTVYISGFPGGRPLSVAKGEYIGNRNIEIIDNIAPGDVCKGRLVRNNPFIEMFTGVTHICVLSLNADQHHLISYGGNSGSPILNRFGNVVGVLFAGSNQPTDALAVPINFVKDFIIEYER